ncbi:MAG: hypothetical protein H7251_11155 [Acetobacteraceae bacterium]|nr:hypothetical protein [Acetobacteraceae bacterium]
MTAPRAGRILRPICRMLGVSATLTPKIVAADVMAKIVPVAAAQAVLVVAARPSRRSPHPGPLPEGEGEGLVPGRIFSGT